MYRLTLWIRCCAPALGFIFLSSRAALAQPSSDVALDTEALSDEAAQDPSQDLESSAASDDAGNESESEHSAEFPLAAEDSNESAPETEAAPTSAAVAPALTPKLEDPNPEPSQAAAPASTAEPASPAHTSDAAPLTLEKKDPEKRIRFYFGGRIAGAFVPQSSHEWKEQCPDFSATAIAATPKCSTQAPIGGAIDGHLGIRGKYFGSEGFILGSADYSVAKVDVDTGYAIPDFAEGMHIGRAKVGTGVSFRGFYDTNVIGFNAALGGGFLWRSVFSSLSSLSGQSEQYVAPIVRFDAGLSLFKFLTAGVLGWVEFSKDVVLHPDLSTFGENSETAEIFGDVTVFLGPQFFLGPYVGIRIN